MTDEQKKMLEKLIANDKHPERGLIVQYWMGDPNNFTSWFARLRDKNLPLNGTYEEWYLNGQLSRVCTYKDGELDGIFERWYPNGQLKERAHFKAGKEDGLSEAWHENGQLFCRGNYKNGELDGLREEWYASGELYGRVFYNIETKHKASTYWHRDGEILEINNYKNGRKDGTQVENNLGGLVLVSTYKDGCFRAQKTFYSIDEALASLERKKKITLKPKKKGGVKL